MKKRVSMVDKSKGFGKDRSSILFMTINSNSQDLVTETQMRKAAEEYFEHIEEFFCFLNRDVSRNNPGFIDEIDVESTVETGKKEKRVHLHSLIRVKHRTKLQVDLRKTHAFFCERLQLKNIYLNVKFIPDNNMSLLKYMRKQ